MRKIFLLCIIIAFSGPFVWASTNPGALFSEPIVTDQGGPDPYGYRWFDNDSAGGPAYNWVDITGIGVEVVGLADDNNFGPVQMGFNFPYYWYTVNHMWIGSNGYTSFSSNFPFNHPFANIPASAAPNDLLAVLTGDLDFTDPDANPSCYYYTNNADSFIVSWIDVPEFTPSGFDFTDSTHTFQLILSARDSSITFQYGENHGAFPSGGSLADVIGIENVNGQVGLQYLRNNLPANHMWRDGLAIRFHPVPNPSYVVHDFGLLDGFEEGSGAVFLHEDSTYMFRALVKNFGNQVEPTLRVSCIARRGASTVVYHDTITVPGLNPGETEWVDFPDPFVTDTSLTYRVTFTTIMSPDQNVNNNTLTCELDSYKLPYTFRYCDEVAETGRSWNGDFSGFGLEFQIPENVRVDSVGFNVWAILDSAGLGGPAYIWIIPDDGFGHPNPNFVLAGDTVNVDTVGWFNVDFSWANLYFGANEKFYMVGIHALETSFSFSMDQTAPLCNRGWEYTGGLAPDRDRGVSDVMFKVYAITPPPGTIAGVVYNPDGTTPEEGVEVTLYRHHPIMILRDSTNVYGAFLFTIDQGIYDLTFQKAGFRDTTVQGVAVLPGQTTTLNMVLAPRPACEYVWGDINNSHNLNGLDVTYGVGYFKGGPPPGYSCDCPPHGVIYAAGDVNGSCSFNGLDVTYLVAYFKGGPPPHPCLDCPGQ